MVYRNHLTQHPKVILIQKILFFQLHAFIYCTKWRFGQVLLMPDSLTHRLKIALLSTQLLTKYKSGALVTQCMFFVLTSSPPAEIILYSISPPKLH